MDKDKNEKQPVIKLGVKLIISGKKGESLFYNTDTFNSLLVTDDNVITISKQLTKYANLVYKEKEERLLALIGAISVEEALDSFLKTYIPDYKRILENTDFTLSMKVEMAYSLRLIPRHILNSADLIRRIRNEFAHKISIDRFDYLDEKLKKKLQIRFKEFCPEEDINNTSFSELFVKVVQFVVLALVTYSYCAKVANEYIYSEDFINLLNKRIEDKAKKQ